MQLTPEQARVLLRLIEHITDDYTSLLFSDEMPPELESLYYDLACFLPWLLERLAFASDNDTPLLRALAGY
jgi:hypothetical protein